MRRALSLLLIWMFIFGDITISTGSPTVKEFKYQEDEEAIENITVRGYNCRSDHPCRRRGEDYFWCYIDYAKNWDYCSVDPSTTRTGQRCKVDSPCSKRGEEYYWCYQQDGDWEYCSPTRKLRTYYEEIRQVNCTACHLKVFDRVERSAKSIEKMISSAHNLVSNCNAIQTYIKDLGEMNYYKVDSFGKCERTQFMENFIHLVNIKKELEYVRIDLDTLAYEGINKATLLLNLMKALKKPGMMDKLDKVLEYASKRMIKLIDGSLIKVNNSIQSYQRINKNLTDVRASFLQLKHKVEPDNSTLITYLGEWKQLDEKWNDAKYAVAAREINKNITKIDQLIEKEVKELNFLHGVILLITGLVEHINQTETDIKVEVHQIKHWRSDLDTAKEYAFESWDLLSFMFDVEVNNVVFQLENLINSMQRYKELVEGKVPTYTPRKQVCPDSFNKTLPSDTSIHLNATVSSDTNLALTINSKVASDTNLPVTKSCIPALPNLNTTQPLTKEPTDKNL